MKNPYATKGLDPAPAVSMTTMPMAGLLVDVYGLDELPPAPAQVTCLWLLHPRTRTRARMRDIACRVVHAWNSRASPPPPASEPVSEDGQEQNPPRTTSRRGLVALAFDMPNHGSREVSQHANQPWNKGNPSHAVDMVSMVRGGAADMAALMDVAAAYLGRQGVTAHVCLGWSLGGHSAWQAWLGEERIDAAVVVVGCPDMMGLLSKRAERAKLDCGGGPLIGSPYFPPSLVTSCQAHDPRGVLFGSPLGGGELPAVPVVSERERRRIGKILGGRVAGKRLLLCSGADDRLVPAAQSRPLVRVLQQAAEQGWCGDDGGGGRGGRFVLDDRVYEGVGHSFSSSMVEDAVEFLVDAVARGPRVRARM